MKKATWYLLIFLLVSQINLHAQSPVIQQIIDSVSIDSLILSVKELSGEIPTIINGTQQKILSRHRDQPGNAFAETYIKQKLESYGFPVIIQPFTATGNNVLATQVGTVFPNRKVILCGHYDSMPEGLIAPGAEDNASGTAGVLESARILSRNSFPLTIVYALWDEEEVYPCGSTYYAVQAAAVGDSILCVINLEEIGYDGNNDGKCGVVDRANVRSVHICEDMTEIVRQYGMNLTLLSEPAWATSDHAPFWYHNYDAISFWHSFSHPYDFYHTTNDRIGAFNVQSFGERVKLVSATVAFYALGLNFDITHTPVAAVVPSQATTAEMSICATLQIGSGALAPRLYYRTKKLDGTYDPFDELTGTQIGSGTYGFTIPSLPNGTAVQYYLAAQDENSTMVRTLPAGGNGFSPPGSTPPGAFYEFLVGDLTVVWSDSVNSLTNWNATGGWNITTEQSVSSPTSFTDSPGRDYPPNSFAILTCKDQIPAQSALRSFLEFDTRWAMEHSTAYGLAQVSIDGKTWHTLSGQYTYLSYDSYTPVKAIYSGVQSTWVHEICEISDYAKHPFQFRFLFISDQWTYFMPLDGWYIDNPKITIQNVAYAHNVTVDRTYIRPNQDTVIISAIVENPNQHPLTILATLTNDSSVVLDSMNLYDDGLHHDGESGDKRWATQYFYDYEDEQIVHVSITMVDPIGGDTRLSNATQFTSIGPLVYKGYTIVTTGDADINPGETHRIKLEIQNLSQTATAINVRANITSLDTFATVMSNSFLFSDVLAGQSKVSGNSRTIKFSENFQGPIDTVRFAIELTSNGYTFWRDSTVMVVVGIESEQPTLPVAYSLKQNYPNPFNPSTTIEFSLPKTEWVTLTVFNILGQQVTTLVSEKLNPGTHKYQWQADNLPSGIYYCRMKAGEYEQVRKMILLQ